MKNGNRIIDDLRKIKALDQTIYNLRREAVLATRERESTISELAKFCDLEYRGDLTLDDIRTYYVESIVDDVD